MEATERFTEVTEVLATLAPITANGTVADHVTGYVDFADFHRGFVSLIAGTPAGASVITVTLQQATDTDGSDFKELTAISKVAGSKAPTALAAGDTEEYIGIELNMPELDVTNGFHCIQVTVAVTVAAYTYALYLYGTVPRYAPCDVTGYAEIVA